MGSPLEITLLVLLGLLWGMPYALTKIALTTIPPITLVGSRVALAAIVLWIIVLFRQRKMPAQWNFVGCLFIQGCVACAIPYTLIAFGQQSVESALTAILNSTAPLFVCLISLLWTRHEPLTVGRLFGVVIGLVGVVLIAGASALAGLGRGTLGQAAIILATLSTAVSAIYGRRRCARAALFFRGSAAEIGALYGLACRFARKCPGGNRARIRGVLSPDPNDRQHGCRQRRLPQASGRRADRLRVDGRGADLDDGSRADCDSDRSSRDQSDRFAGSLIALGPIATNTERRVERAASTTRHV